MSRNFSPPRTIADRFCQPRRLGLFGRRGVGKTTLLTMLYREAAGGRLPGLRLAAADAATATYLADKIAQLESGQPLPATLAETELRFRLYCRGSCLELIVKDYQGEHVALGRHESIREFLRDCDAVWLCLDDPGAATSADRLQAQQEIEQIVEDYLAARPTEEPHRPTAILLTKADLHDPAADVAGRFDMAVHALATHCPQHRLFSVSSLRGPEEGTFSLRPAGLAEPLAWLAEVLEAQDEARIQSLWHRFGTNPALLDRCVASHSQRFAASPFASEQRRRLREQQRRRRGRRLRAWSAAALALVLTLVGYDALAARQVRQFASANADDPAAVRNNWQRFRAWHPTRNLLWPGSAGAEAAALADLDERIVEQRYGRQLSELARLAGDADADPEAVWQRYCSLRAEFPDREPDESLERVRENARRRHDDAHEKAARSALADLQQAELQADLTRLIARADQILSDHGDTVAAAEVRRRRDSYLQRLDHQAIEAARDYSAREPLNYFTRRQRYQSYLDHHPLGAFAAEAGTAIETISVEWDRHDYRAVRDFFREHPGDVKELEVRGRAYLAGHPQGRFQKPVRELLPWAERVVEPQEYHVRLRSGHFDRKVAWMLSWGPDLSVEIEVNGVSHGPSQIVKNSYDPTWDYEFPRRIRWKLGDPIRIRVFDHDYYKRLVVDCVSEANDPLALSMLGGEVVCGKNTLKFDSDFHLPELPPAE